MVREPRKCLRRSLHQECAEAVLEPGALGLQRLGETKQHGVAVTARCQGPHAQPIVLVEIIKQLRADTILKTRSATISSCHIAQQNTRM